MTKYLNVCDLTVDNVILIITFLCRDIVKNFCGFLQVTYDVHQKRDLIDIFDKINDTLRRIVGHLHGKFHDLHDFLHQAIAHGKDKLKPHIENIKSLAKTFIDHINMVSAKVAQQALEFFKPWASKLGDTWTKLVKDIHERLQKLHPTALPLY
ncbi:uncharacterized protein LOC106879077 [Octopus bimaculoides]|uniref:uncharacterized protein LOC106879077 n=1 Tax=Octopus bimaculoides TaxID=37653 RepID=UPI00071D071D|nr:uncharacterized protein LOC106879077 [Octopus bimaculoides]|eukprot:XP_014783997.1 PREDICTED: uncharacterized protein LOC106879077 [Octopus bimaculoides]